MGYIPPPPPARWRAEAYEPLGPDYEHSWQDPESDDYDPLRVIKERQKNETDAGIQQAV